MRCETRAHLATACAVLLAVACAHGSDTDKAAAPRTPPGQPPLAAAPSDLLQPASQKKISQALKSKGFADRDELKGEQLSAALRKFQQSEGLAATGFPDRETLSRLGLDPEEVDSSLERFSGSKPSDGAGKGGSGAEGPGKATPSRNATPPKDEPARGDPE